MAAWRLHTWHIIPPSAQVGDGIWEPHARRAEAAQQELKFICGTLTISVFKEETPEAEPLQGRRSVLCPVLFSCPSVLWT